MARAIIFDMTQTLQRFDFAHMQSEFHKIIKEIPKARGIPIARFMKAYFAAYDLYQVGRIKKDRQFAKNIFSQLGMSLSKRETDFFIREHRECRSEFIRLAPKLAQTLKALKKAGFRLGLLSNGVQNWVGDDWRFLHFSPNKFFEAQVFSQSTGFLKPDSRAYYAVLKKMRLKPKEAVHVGDNYGQDVLGAKRIGMCTVWLNTRGEKRKADFGIGKLFELVQLSAYFKGI